MFLYDADDERVMTFDCALVECATQTSRLTTTIRGLDGKVLRVYNFDLGGQWEWERDYVYRGGQLLASVEPDGAGGEAISHFHLDHLGSPRQITDSGALESAFHTYYPFGGEATDPTQDEVRLKFTGHERDENGSTGSGMLDYMHGRFFSPALGRFTSIDPISSGNQGNPQTWGKYVYSLSNPLTFVDPDGRSQKRVHVAHTRAVLQDRGFSLVAIEAILRANLRSDTFLPYRVQLSNHATSFFLSDKASNLRGSRFAQRKLRRAIRLARQGKINRSLKALGRSLHAAEDVVAHRGLGNVTVTAFQHVVSGFEGKRWERHRTQDQSLNVTDTGDPLTGEVTGVRNASDHVEIMDSLGAIVDEYLDAIKDLDLFDSTTIQP